MANTYLALADLLKANDKNLADRDVTDILNQAPVIAQLAAEAVPGTTHKYLKETTAPSAGFRDVNDGVENSDSEDTLVTVTLEILDSSFAVDKALADAYIKGPDEYISREALRHLRAAFFKAEGQLLYGTATGGDADGFAGLVDSLEFGGDMVVDATGTTEGAASTVFAVRSTGALNDVMVVAGENAELSIGDSVVQRMAGNTGFYPAYYTPISAWLALQVGSVYSAGRIANVTTDTGKGLTDDLISDLLALFPAGREATHLIMSRRSRKQLQQSRTATNATGAPAPFPTEAFGVPIIVTDAVSDTGAIEAESS